MLETPQRVGFGHFQSLLKILAYLPDTGSLTQPDAVLEVKEQAAVVQIDGAHSGEAVVHNKVFGVDKAGGYTRIFLRCLQQGGDSGPG